MTAYEDVPSQADARAEALVKVAEMFAVASEAYGQEEDLPGEVLEALRFLLPDDDFTMLAAMLEVCPMHLCDVAICADDEVKACAEVRA